jgi:cytochrome c553
MKRSVAVAITLAAAIAAATHGVTRPVASPKPGAAVEAAASRCAFCHGPTGTSQHPIWPSLAGMDADYLKRQLDGFAAGAQGPRRSPHAGQMYAISAWLGEDRRWLRTTRRCRRPPGCLPPAPRVCASCSNKEAGRLSLVRVVTGRRARAFPK